MFRRSLVRKRRLMIWRPVRLKLELDAVRNAMKLRLAVTVYARTTLPMALRSR